MTTLPVLAPSSACWQKIGVWGDRSCQELTQVTHCHNCPVFASAGRRFLDAPTPAGYLEEWTTRLGRAEADQPGEQLSVLIFRISDEWLALPVTVLMEVTPMRPIHRIPHRSGLLAGLVNIRGELHLCVRLDLLLSTADSDRVSDANNPRLVVMRQGTDSWVFAADEIEQVLSISLDNLVPPAPTLARYSSRYTRGVFTLDRMTVGLLDEARLIRALRERTR